MTRFLIVGDANVDIIISGMEGLPTLGQELYCQQLTMHLGGSCANCASGLAGLGASVDLWGKVGGDSFGDFVLHEMRTRHIDISHVIQEPNLRTGACVALSMSNDRALVSYLGSIAALHLKDLPLDQIGRYDHMHSGSIFLQHGLQLDFVNLFKAARNAGLTTSLDSGWDPSNRWEVDIKTWLPYVDVFIPNELEAMQITRTSSVADAASELSRYGNTIVIKRGKAGALAQKGSQVWEVPAFEIDTVETTGAGDCFNAGLLFALFQECQSIPDALRFANACGAIGASTPGGSSAVISAAEVCQFIHQQHDTASTFTS